MPQTICLNMIVKDEARVIRRCLDSVRPFIDHWVVVDTGSSDGTQDLVREILRDVPGELHARPWRDFGHNRTEALRLADGKADYVLVIDADEMLIAEPGFRMPPLSAGAYSTRHHLVASDISYLRMQIVRAELGWRYEGVLHEYLTCDAEHASERLDGLSVESYPDGACNVEPQRKYEADAALLGRALESEPDNERYVFYLAQSQRDAGRLEAARDTYARRDAMGGWAKEAWYALYQVAVMEERMAVPFETLIARYLEAYRYRPSRAEPLCQLARRCREADEYALGFLFANTAISVPRPTTSCFSTNPCMPDARTTSTP